MFKGDAETPEVTAPGPQPATRATRPHTLAAVAAARSSGGSRGHRHRTGPGADQLTQAELAGRLLGAVDDTRGDAGDGGLEPRGRRLQRVGIRVGVGV